MKNQLEIYRKYIDQIDDQLLNLLNKRLKICKKIGDYKRKMKIEVYDRAREKQIFKNLNKKSIKANLNKKYINKLFELIIKNSREIQR